MTNDLLKRDGELIIQSFRDICRMLEDDESRDIYGKRLAYAVTGDSSYITDIVRKYRPEFSPLASWGGVKWLYESLPTDKQFVIWGAGEWGKMWLPYIEGDGRFIAFCDRDLKKQQEGYCGYRTVNPQEILTQQRGKVVVVVATAKYEREILEELKRHQWPEEDIRLTGTVINQGSPRQYFREEFIRFEDEEIFVDAGCYDLNTTIQLQSLCPKLKEVYAFEPNVENYEKCERLVKEQGYEFVKLLPYGTWDKRETLCFRSMDDSSRVGEDGDCFIEAISIDEVVKDANVTFIKMDVEGAEYHSLVGARKTIQKCKPKLAISIYHKPEDLSVIPRYIKELVPEYRFYIRHYSNANNETVLYAVPYSIG